MSRNQMIRSIEVPVHPRPIHPCARCGDDSAVVIADGMELCGDCFLSESIRKLTVEINEARGPRSALLLREFADVLEGELISWPKALPDARS